MYRKTRAQLTWATVIAITTTLAACKRNLDDGGSLKSSGSDLQSTLLSNAKDVVDLKMRILNAIRYPAASFAFVLGYTYATGTGASGTRQGEDMSIINDPSTAEPTGWHANYRSEDAPAKQPHADQRLDVVLYDWGMEALNVEYTGNPVIKSLEPITIDTVEVNNDGDKDAVQTYKIAKTVSTSYTYTQNNTFKWTAGVSTSFTAGVPLIAGGTIDLKLEFGSEHSFGTSQQIAESTLKDATIQIPVPAHTKMKVDIIVNKQSCSIPYTAKVKILAKLKYKGLLRKGDPANPKSRNFNQQFRDSGADNYLEANFGANNRTFYEDLASQAVNGGLPWLWEDMWAAWGDEGKSHLQALVNPDNFILPLSGVLTYEDGLKVTYKINNNTGSQTITPVSSTGG